MQIDHEYGSDDEEDAALFVAPGLDEEEPSVDVGDEENDDIDADPDGDAAVPAAYTVEDYVRVAKIEEEGGEVTCTIAPFSELPRFGRWSDWPKTTEPSKRSVGMRCYMHPNCSITKRRQQVTDHQLLMWLCAGKVAPPGSSSLAREGLRDEHKGLFYTYCT